MKTCSHKGCTYPVFGGGMCTWHQSYRTDRKRSTLKRTPIPQISPKKRLKIPEEKALSEKDKLFFAEIWQERPHNCFETGKYLGEEPLSLFFHHVLKRRGRYARFRWAKWNIVLLNWQSHSNENYMKAIPKVKEYHDYLIKNLDLIEAGKLNPLKTFKNEQIFLDTTEF